jgi:Mg2+/Co2+ transporter CorC
VVSHALDVMLSAGQGRLPVTDPESGALVGLLTRKDLLQVRAATVRAEAERRAYFRRDRIGTGASGA